MVVFDKYNGPSFIVDEQELCDSHGKKVVPILCVHHKFLLSSVTYVQEQFLLTISYTITVYKAQRATISRAITKIIMREFAFGLNYITCSWVVSLQGLIFEKLFDRSMVCKDPTEGKYTMLTHILLLIFDIGIKMNHTDEEFWHTHYIFKLPPYAPRFD